MRNFNISHVKYMGNNEYNYIIVVNNKDLSLITSDRLSEYYNIDIDTLNMMKKSYNFLCYCCGYAAISFLTAEDTQKFIDNVLIPYEIAFNLNGEI